MEQFMGPYLGLNEIVRWTLQMPPVPWLMIVQPLTWIVMWTVVFTCLNGKDR